ncbi:MAG: serine kinase [Rhizonema sp. PD38]|nr:serine kinase [Rhizonema sp. PD38]
MSEDTAQLPDVVISLRKITDSEAESADGEDRILGLIEDPSRVCRFLAEFGSKIIVEPAPGMENDVLRPYILGPMFAVLLRQRGLLILHASSVAINDEAIAFLGHSGWGKSTLASAFYNQGYSLLTDDLMAIQVEGRHPITFPGYPYVRLLPDSAASLGYDFKSLIPINSLVPKRNNSLMRGFPQKPFPLKRLYVLENVARSQNEIESLQLQESLVELIRHSRVMNILTTKDFISSHLRQCSELLRKVPVYRLKRQHSLAALPNIVQLVEEDVTKSANVQPHTLKTAV